MRRVEAHEEEEGGPGARCGPRARPRAFCARGAARDLSYKHVMTHMNMKRAKRVCFGSPGRIASQDFSFLKKMKKLTCN